MRRAYRHIAYAAGCCDVDADAIIDTNTGELLELQCPCGSVSYGELGPVGWMIEPGADSHPFFDDWAAFYEAEAK